MEQFANYKNEGPGTSLYDNVPIEALDIFRKSAKEAGLKCRVVYRGPRPVYFKDGYARNLGRSFCLQENANRFSVYPIGERA